MAIFDSPSGVVNMAQTHIREMQENVNEVVEVINEMKGWAAKADARHKSYSDRCGEMFRTQGWLLIWQSSVNGNKGGWVISSLTRGN